MQKPELINSGGEQYSTRGRTKLVQNLPVELFRFVNRELNTKTLSTTSKLKTSVIFSGGEFEVEAICIYGNEKVIEQLKTLELVPFSVDYHGQETIVRVNWPKWSLRKPPIGLLFLLKGTYNYYAAKVEAQWLGGTSGPDATCHQVNVGASELFAFPLDSYYDFNSLVYNDNIVRFHEFQNSSKKPKRKPTKKATKKTTHDSEPKLKRRKKECSIQDSPPVSPSIDSPILNPTNSFTEFLGSHQVSGFGHPSGVEEFPNGQIRYKGILYAPIPVSSFSSPTWNDVTSDEDDRNESGSSVTGSEDDACSPPLFLPYFFSQDDFRDSVVEVPSTDL